MNNVNQNKTSLLTLISWLCAASEQLGPQRPWDPPSLSALLSGYLGEAL